MNKKKLLILITLVACCPLKITCADWFTDLFKKSRKYPIHTQIAILDVESKYRRNKAKKILKDIQTDYEDRKEEILERATKAEGIREEERRALQEGYKKIVDEMERKYNAKIVPNLGGVDESIELFQKTLDIAKATTEQLERARIENKHTRELLKFANKVRKDFDKIIKKIYKDIKKYDKILKLPLPPIKPGKKGKKAEREEPEWEKEEEETPGDPITPAQRKEKRDLKMEEFLWEQTEKLSKISQQIRILTARIDKRKATKKEYPPKEILDQIKKIGETRAKLNKLAWNEYKAKVHRKDTDLTQEKLDQLASDLDALAKEIDDLLKEY
jgi:hypothetical protein